jgi:hypothetical protein
MSAVSNSGSASNLQEAMKGIGAAWEHTRSQWRDAKAQEFERQYLERLPSDMARAITVMEEISVLLKKIHDDCE